MARENTGLTTRQIKAAHLIGTGSTQRHAAEVVGVTEQTVTQWTKIPAFRALRDEVCSQYVDSVIPEAVQVFVDQIRDESDKTGWLKQNAAGRLIALKEAQRQRDSTSQVMFTFQAVEPGMPGTADEGSPESTP